MSRRKPTPEELTTAFNVYSYLGSIVRLVEDTALFRYVMSQRKFDHCTLVSMLHSNARVRFPLCFFHFFDAVTVSQSTMMALKRRNPDTNYNVSVSIAPGVDRLLLLTVVLPTLFFALISIKLSLVVMRQGQLHNRSCQTSWSPRHKFLATNNTETQNITGYTLDVYTTPIANNPACFVRS